MKSKILGLLAVGLLVGPMQGFATPMNFTIKFSLTEGNSTPTSGSFTYDSAAPIFTNFLVAWNGSTFDLTSSANSPIRNGGACGFEPGPVGTFAFLSRPGEPPCVNSSWLGFTNDRLSYFEFFSGADPDAIGVFDVLFGRPPTAANALGSWSISPVGVPEPASIALLALGLAGIGLSRRRKAA